MVALSYLGIIFHSHFGVNNFFSDYLFRGRKITTGSRRVHDFKMLLENVERFGLKAEGLAGYLSIFKYGCPPHGGFAIGLERPTQKVLGLINVKEACPFPRDRKWVGP